MRNKFRRSLGALLVGLSTLLMADVWAQQADRLSEVRANGVLEVAVYKDFPPYSYTSEQGRTVGIDVDLAEALAQKLGVQVRIRSVVADETLDDDLRNSVWKGHYLGGGVADLMLHVGMDAVYAARQDKVSLFAPYYGEQVVVAYRKSRFSEPFMLMQLDQRKVAVELDSMADFYVSGVYNGGLRDSAVRVHDTSAAVAEFVAGRVDAVLAPRGELQGALHRRGEALASADVALMPLQASGMFRGHWDVGMAIKAGNPQLRQALEQAMAELRQESRLQAIFAAHGVEYAPARWTPSAD